MEITNINELKIGQKVWWFGKYGDLMGGDKGAIITEIEPKSNYYNGTWYDSFSCDITERVFIKDRDIYETTYSECGTSSNAKCVGVEIVNKWETQTRHYGVSIQGNQIYTSKPNNGEFVDDSVEFERPCHEDNCNGTIYGNGWTDGNGEIVKFGYQECNTCDWNQGS